MSKVFTDFKSFYDYIPDCLLCHHPLLFYISGWDHNLRSYATYNFKLENNQLRARLNNTNDDSIIIDCSSNQIIENEVKIINMSGSPAISVYKKCKKCKFHIYARLINNEIILLFEEIEYYSNKDPGKLSYFLYLKNVYFKTSTSNDMDCSYITLKPGKRMKIRMPIDLSEVQSLRQLKKKIDTVLTLL
jgi:hypothetical protein